MALSPVKITTELLDKIIASGPEREGLEFKEARDNYDSNNLHKYCAAIANEGGGYFILGVTDKLRHVVGTRAFPNLKKTQKTMFDKLHFRVDLEEIRYRGVRVVVCVIPSRPTGEAYSLDGAYWMRIGESLEPMTPDRLREIHREKTGPKSNLDLDRDKRPRRFVVFLALAISLGTALLLLIGMYAKRVESPALTTGTRSSKDNVAVVVKRDWHNKENWRTYLKLGMTKAQVQQLFGPPDGISVQQGEELWQYGAGNMFFEEDSTESPGKLVQWSEP